MPRVQLSQAASLGLWTDLKARLPELEAALPSIHVPLGVLVAALSPMPPSAGMETAARIPAAWSHLEPRAGHLRPARGAGLCRSRDGPPDLERVSQGRDVNRRSAMRR